MGKKPKPTPPPPPAPAGLSEKSRRLWEAAMAIQRRWNAARLEVLHQALYALDRSDEAREAVSREGLTTTTESTGATHLNPCVRVEREFRQQFMRCVEQLNLMSLAGDFMKPAELLADHFDERI